MPRYLENKSEVRGQLNFLEMIIYSIEQYKELRKGLEVDPLLTAWDDDEAMIRLPIEVRVAIQNEIFHGDKNRFYKWVWEHKTPHVCEESGRYLQGYSATYISHILTRGAHPEKALDPRNVNLLTYQMHQKWETGERKEMRIYWRNQNRIEKLNREYRQLIPRKIF